MHHYNEEYEDKIVYSPLKLLYSAYTDERPVVSQAMEDGFREIDKYLAPLSEKDQKAVFQTFCNIYTENEKLAFTEGIRVGMHLAEELAM